MSKRRRPYDSQFLNKINTYKTKINFKTSHKIGSIFNQFKANQFKTINFISLKYCMNNYHWSITQSSTIKTKMHCMNCKTIRNIMLRISNKDTNSNFLKTNRETEVPQMKVFELVNTIIIRKSNSKTSIWLIGHFKLNLKKSKNDRKKLCSDSNKKRREKKLSNIIPLVEKVVVLQTGIFNTKQFISSHKF